MGSTVRMKFWIRVLNSGARKSFGGIAQLVERLVRNEKARGSNPLTSNFRVCQNDLTDDADQVMHLPVEG